ncbi:MAG: aminotransferase class I/II-fold pyridoxal phosphate-dependent enzyme [Erysipelotrichaceae bacterium]|nr:aminotransferase class I/II-fold pyridoxal phosphate-dependent enzyme [Erysipelotrichaceae bacterium]MDY5251508.1 aminotransferase class I/II-fold pyridoxal phosphate-dependent enzyme [Erysipelotrichaceae bacterium]
MQYDFESIIERAGKDAIAVDRPLREGYMNTQVKEGFSIIPMWVADMNFATLPDITTAIIERAKHPTYGYFDPSDEYYASIIEWHRKRYGVNDLKPEYIGYENGVLGGIASALRVLCAPGDNILIQAPTYIGFSKTCADNGYNLILNQLIQDDEGIWRIDYDDVESKLKEHDIHTAIFCSPHNPLGRVWEAEEIARLMEIYREHDVYVIADEIWADLIMPNKKHIPVHTISEDAKKRTITLYAPSKTFNLAGLVGSYHVIYDDYLRARVNKEARRTHYNAMNVLSMHALIAAYSVNGAIWLEQLKEVLQNNIDYACNFISENFPDVKLSKPQGTYMLFLDCQQYCQKHDISIEQLQKLGVEHGVIWQDGRAFHGMTHIRMNVALPLELLEEAMHRLKRYVFIK